MRAFLPGRTPGHASHQGSTGGSLTPQSRLIITSLPERRQTRSRCPKKAPVSAFSWRIARHSSSTRTRSWATRARRRISSRRPICGSRRPPKESSRTRPATSTGSFAISLSICAAACSPISAATPAQLVLVPADAADSGEDRLLERDELRRIEGALAELSPNVRDAFKMRRIGGYTLQEIADRFEVSIPTIDRWTQEALKHLSLRLHRSKRR